MKSLTYASMALAVFAGMGLAGCANPADETPSAVVTEVAPAPEAAPATEAAPAPEAAPAAEGPAADGTTYTIAPTSSISFVGSKVTGSHDGGFNQFAGTVTVPGEDLTRAGIEVSIDMTSVWTDADGLTKHLLSADFFEVETYPESRFVSTAIAKEGDGYTVTGDFTLHGVTKSISFPASLSLADGKVAASAEFDINRKDFEIVYPGKPDDLIRDEVVIKLNIEATAS